MQIINSMVFVKAMYGGQKSSFSADTGRVVIAELSLTCVHEGAKCAKTDAKSS